MNDSEEAEAKNRVQFCSALQRLPPVRHLNFMLSS